MLSLLLFILVVFIVVGIILYLFNRFVTVVPANIKEAINVIAWGVTVIWALLHLIGKV